tara:strand:+ start:417 stop:1211 length:795 start_codon:yes stop_codon:yes gene_type:complete
MRIVTITGNHLRHNYFLSSISNHFDIEGSVINGREKIIPEPPAGLSSIDKENFINHFQTRDEKEISYFYEKVKKNVKNQLNIVPDELNTNKTARFIESCSPDLVFIFGVGMIKSPLLDVLPKYTINMHGGLSPRYRGSATLFWPFYFLEPAYAGMTFHYITSEPDAGNIIHQVVPKLKQGDGIHDVGCKAVLSGTNGVIELISSYQKKGDFKSHKQKGTGKNFLASDFKVEHLRLIYNTFNDDIVDHFLKGKISKKIPKLIRQF